MSDWIINPNLDMVSILAQYSRFLESDYRMAIEHLEIPRTFEENDTKTGRNFLIISYKEAPWVVAKSVFLCLKLAGPDSVVVKTYSLDDYFMVQNVFENFGEGVRTKVLLTMHDELKLSNDWRDEIELSTDIIVFGDSNAMEAFREYETVDRRVWEHGFKFSFGVVKSENLNMTIIRQICFDFFSFYGEGTLAPKFYFIIGPITKSMVKHFSATMQSLYEIAIDEYRSKLPLTRKSDLAKNLVEANHYAKFVRIDSLNSREKFDKLYGDIRLIHVDDLEQIGDYIDKVGDSISTIAVNFEDDHDVLDYLEDRMVMRVCEVGEMQFPEFFEQYDNIDDFNIYAPEEDDLDCFFNGDEDYI